MRPAAGRWEVEPSSTVGFVARQFLVQRVRGRFQRFAAPLEVAGDGRATVTGQVEAASVDTGDPARDRHLRSADFFDVARWPTMTLVGQVVPRSDDPAELVCEAELTIRDVTRPVPFAVQLLGQGPGAGTEGVTRSEPDVTGSGSDVATLTATVSAAVNRKDFGLRWAPALESGGVLVSDSVDLLLHLRVRRQAT